MFANKFWMVYVEGKGDPHRKHVKKDLAVNEAQRLFLKYNRTHPVYVLQLIKTFK